MIYMFKGSVSTNNEVKNLNDEIKVVRNNNHNRDQEEIIEFD